MKHLGPSYVSRPFPTSEVVEKAAPWFRSAGIPLSPGQYCYSLPHHALPGTGYTTRAPGPPSLAQLSSQARLGSSGPSFLCFSLSSGQKKAEAAAPCCRTLGRVTRRTGLRREGRRAATRKRIHIETLPHVLDEVGRLLAMRQLFIRFHSAAAARRVLQLFSSKEPARRSSTARRHDTSSSARTLSPPPPRRPPGLGAKASRPRPNALSVEWVTPFPSRPQPVRTRRSPPCRLAQAFWLSLSGLPPLSGPPDHNAPRRLSLRRRRK